MSGTGESRAAFAGEEREFRIRLGEIRRIESRCDSSIGEVLRRLSRATLVLARVQGLEALATGIEVRADDVREPIFQGLRGAGMTDRDATALLEREIDSRGVQGLMDHAPTALTVLWASQAAPEEDAPGEPQAGENPATRTSASTSQTSTASAPPSA